jgi:hypothetical protein
LVLEIVACGELNEADEWYLELAMEPLVVWIDEAKARDWEEPVCAWGSVKLEPEAAGELKFFSDMKVISLMVWLLI